MRRSAQSPAASKRSTAQAILDEPGHILVPNADYLAALTPVGTSFPTKPQFEPDAPSPKHPYALALTGQIDKGDSVPRICRSRSPLSGRTFRAPRRSAG
jgi:hypothetical protein